MRKKVIKWVSIPLLIVLVLALGITIYFSDYYHPQNHALSLIDSEPSILQEADCLVYMPEEPVAGLIFYPGAKVAYESYSPLMNQLSEEGILCVVPHLLGNFAFFEMNAADGIIERYPEIEHWYIGGHSLGGVVAGSYVADHPDQFEGLVLLASYVADDLSQTKISVLSVYGSNDEVLSREQYRKQKKYLPSVLREVVINGGCHAYFGNYGEQSGDGEASISREEQQDITCKAIRSFIEATNMKQIK